MAIAERLGAKVFTNPWVNHAEQFQWGLEYCPIETEWVMRMDADEYIESALITEISEKLPLLGADITGVNLKRKHHF